MTAFDGTTSSSSRTEVQEACMDESIFICSIFVLLFCEATVYDHYTPGLKKQWKYSKTTFATFTISKLIIKKQQMQQLLLICSSGD